jgi:hypothetical protein
MRLTVVSFVLVSSAVFAQDIPQIQFDSAPEPLKLPDGMYFGELTGVAVNSKGHVFALSRGNTSGPAYAAAATWVIGCAARATPSATASMGCFLMSSIPVCRFRKSRARQYRMSASRQDFGVEMTSR